MSGATRRRTISGTRSPRLTRSTRTRRSRPWRSTRTPARSRTSISTTSTPTLISSVVLIATKSPTGWTEMTAAAGQKECHAEKLKKGIVEGGNREKDGVKEEMKPLKDKITPEQTDALTAYVKGLK